MNVINQTLFSTQEKLINLFWTLWIILIYNQILTYISGQRIIGTGLSLLIIVTLFIIINKQVSLRVKEEHLRKLKELFKDGVCPYTFLNLLDEKEMKAWISLLYHKVGFISYSLTDEHIIFRTTEVINKKLIHATLTKIKLSPGDFVIHEYNSYIVLTSYTVEQSGVVVNISGLLKLEE